MNQGSKVPAVHPFAVISLADAPTLQLWKSQCRRGGERSEKGGQYRIGSAKRVGLPSDQSAQYLRSEQVNLRHFQERRGVVSIS
jgi:hypothetical protein